MPLTSKGNEVMAKLKKEYGPESGERVFYAMKNKGTLTGVDSDDLRDDKDDILSLNRRRATDALEKADREGLIRQPRADADAPGTSEDQVPIPADYGTKLDAAADAADKLMVRLGSYMDRNDGQMCNIADAESGNKKLEEDLKWLQQSLKEARQLGNRAEASEYERDISAIKRKLGRKDSDVAAERHGIEIGGKREMVR